MSGIDELISKSFSEIIKKNLDPDKGKKVKFRLFKKYGLSIHQSIKDFSKLDEVLREVLDSKASNFEQRCLLEVITLKNLKEISIVTIKEKNLINSIMEILGDDEYRKIIESTLIKPLLISEIIELCGLPKTSGYRKINYLIRNGFLIEVGKEFTLKRRSIEKFSTIFQKIILEINQKQSFVKLAIPTKIVKNSSFVQIIKL